MCDKERFTALFHSHERGLFSYLLALTGNFAAAEDALQEASVVMWQKFSEFEEGTNFNAWARKIATHMALRSRKEAARRLPLFSNQFIDAVTEANIDAEEDRDYRSRAMQRCIQKLSPSDQELVAFRYSDEGLTAKKVAERLNRPANTVYKALRRIRVTLSECVRRAIQQEGQA